MHPKPHGFSLIELSIVVSIIGVLAAIAVPNFTKMSCRARQAEAKTNLRAAMTALSQYRHEHEGQADVTAEVPCGTRARNEFGFQPTGNARYRYELNFNPVSNGGFMQATALGCQTDNASDVFKSFEWFTCKNCCVGFSTPSSSVTICQPFFDATQMGLDACR